MSPSFINLIINSILKPLICIISSNNEKRYWIKLRWFNFRNGYSVCIINLYFLDCFHRILDWNRSWCLYSELKWWWVNFFSIGVLTIMPFVGRLQVIESIPFCNTIFFCFRLWVASSWWWRKMVNSCTYRTMPQNT